jgi:hypothetical protein
MNIEKSFPETSCTCAKCVSMCYHVPCWPTPEEVDRITKAGFGGRLVKIQNDYYTDYPVFLLTPATVGNEGKPTDSRFADSRFGKCTFLKNDRCELHNLGLKPLEGRTATHETSKDSDPVRKYILSLWAEKANQKVEF